MAAAAGQVAATIAKIAIGLIQKEQADQAAEERQSQIMDALNKIQGTLQTIQVQQEQLADIQMLHSSLLVIQTWQEGYPAAVKNNDTENINSYLQAFNSKGANGAASNILNIFNVLTGQGEAPSGVSGATPLVGIWHDQSYDKMYSQDELTLQEYLVDFDNSLAWAFGMAGFAMTCQIIALQETSELADKTTTPQEIQNEVENITTKFAANVSQVFETAYQQFPAFVKKFKVNYQDEGSNLTNWFRMWRNNTHVKNYTPIAGDPHMTMLNPSSSSNVLAYAYEVYPTPCDDDEGIYPEVEFRFDETAHPLKGPAIIYSRDGDQPLVPFDVKGRLGLTTTTDPSYWPSGANVGAITFNFNVLPVSKKHSNTDAPAFVLMLCSPADSQGWPWDIGSASPLEYWILRDDGTIQSPWVRTEGGPATPPGQQPTAGPNPDDNGQNQSQWEPIW
ncbi:hypothetical protein FPANT_8491 [Fusarium pseudoanthophilum]|uniref:Uncharacterized protein n=1 Tax=Fusarium pseudoanthophilum TaxID=48495 RepID=A0A8H5L2J3_9HYPO|nr:hypothetical protein FPANT_8491 [Fusarium pseudoanthophilum]